MVEEAVPLDGNLDDWDDVWAEYDGRREDPAVPSGRSPLAECPAPAQDMGLSRFARVLCFLSAVVLVGLAAWVAPSWIAVGHFVESVEAEDPSGAVDYADITALRRDVAGELNSRIPGGMEEGATAFLQSMAGDMTAAWGEREAVAAWLRLRQSPAAGLDPVLQPLGHSRGTTEAGWSRARLNYAGGVSFDLAFGKPEPRWTGINFSR